MLNSETTGRLKHLRWLTEIFLSGLPKIFWKVGNKKCLGWVKNVFGGVAKIGGTANNFGGSNFLHEMRDDESPSEILHSLMLTGRQFC